MSRKLVDREHLQHLDSELFFIKLQAPEALQGRIEDLIKYVKENIIQHDKESLNEIKRTVHRLRKEAKTQEESLQWHQYYMSLDNT